MYKIVRKENGQLWDRIIPEKPLRPFFYTSQKEVFDYCIKLGFLSGETYLPAMRLTENDESSFGFYIARYKRFYDRYLSADLDLESVLSPYISESFDKGNGNEFKSGKFYSVASSSRFAVSSFSEKSKQGLIQLLDTLRINGKIENVEIRLEESLYIDGLSKGAIPPQMDVIIKTRTNDTYFVEVKCHEIFDSHKKIKLKWKYIDTVPFMRLQAAFPNLPMKVSSDGEYITFNGKLLSAENFDCKLATTHFDMKQFICHLMGISSYGDANKHEKLHFYYLYYKNDRYINMPKARSTIYSELEDEISQVFRVFEKVFPEVGFGYCYNSNFDTLSSLEKE